MSSSVDEIEYLATEIITNSKPVSYHKFSRQLNIHLSKAKATLLEYYQKNKSDLTATFIVTGDNDSGKLIKLSNEDELESDLKSSTQFVVFTFIVFPRNCFSFQLTNLH